MCSELYPSDLLEDSMTNISVALVDESPIKALKEMVTSDSPNVCVCYSSRFQVFVKEAMLTGFPQWCNM